MSFQFESSQIQMTVRQSPPVSVSSDLLPLGSLAPWRARKVHCYIEEHLGQSLNTDVLAHVAHVSRSHFCRAFKRTFGVTVHWYVIQRRLEGAKRLMLTTPATLTEIAIACGMSDHSHMTRLFRRVVEESPAAWRRRNLTSRAAATRTAAEICQSAVN